MSRSRAGNNDCFQNENTMFLKCLESAGHCRKEKDVTAIVCADACVKKSFRTFHNWFVVRVLILRATMYAFCCKAPLS